MARRKKRSPREKDAPQRDDTGPAKRSLPPANPPRRNLPLLIVAVVVFALWCGVLVYLAVNR